MERGFGKYILVDRLGVGGMAEVFKARLEGPGGFEKYLAIKMITPNVSDDPEFVEMFMREANLSAMLDHANIVRVHEFDWAEDRYYLAMEYVDGRDLLSVISRCREMYRPLRVPEVLLIGLEICRGLAYAHGELTPGGHIVIHRDISPQNVLLSKAGEVKITDFGIAKLLSGQHYTNTGRVIGKNTYMSPEQAMCEELDRRSDVFSAGCVLWEMLTCQKLFATGKDIPVLDGKLVIKPPSTLNKDVPAALDRLVIKALERDRENRTCSATELGQGLEDVLSTFPGVSRSTDLSGLYSHLFGGEMESQRIGNDWLGEVVMPGSARLERTKSGLPRKQSQVVQEPPTIIHHDVRVDDLLALVPSTTKDRQSDVLLAELVKPISKGMRWSAILLLATLVPIAVCASAWTTSAGLEMLGQLEDDPPPTVRGGLDVREASMGSLSSDQKPSEAIWSLLDGPPPGSEASEGLQSESWALKGKKKPSKGNGAGSGWLSINAIPWAEVFWDGIFLGESPLERIKMPVGKHTLVLVNNCVGDNKTVEVQILRGRLTKVVVDLLK